MRLSKDGQDFIKSYESLKLRAYPDPKTGGKPWTVGWGHTGSDVAPGVVWTIQEADDAFLRDALFFEDGVTGLCPNGLTQQRFDALVSFAFNLGLAKLQSSTLLKLYKAGNYTGAANELLRWVSPGTNVEAGLRKRRTAERDIFLNNRYVMHK